MSTIEEINNEIKRIRAEVNGLWNRLDGATEEQQGHIFDIIKIKENSIASLYNKLPNLESGLELNRQHAMGSSCFDVGGITESLSQVLMFDVGGHTATESTPLLNFIEELRKLSTRCVHEGTIISEKAMKVTMRNRDGAVHNLQSIILNEALLSDTQRSDKRQHVLPVISTLSGFGKSRILLELKGICLKHNWRYEYITYNQGYSESAQEKQYNAAFMLAWRLIYFYFSPDQTWDNFLANLTTKEIIQSLSVEEALSIIVGDKSTDSNERPVFVIAIDEFQVLSCDQEKNRLADVIAALSSTMCREKLPFIIVPVFAGLYLKPFDDAAKVSSVHPQPILLEPLSYDDASEVLREYSGDRNIMLSPIVQELVWQFSAMPAYLLDLYDHYDKNENWEQSCNDVQNARMTRQTAYLDSGGLETLFRIIACAITKFSVSPEICSGEMLDGVGVCWFEDRAKALVNVPFSLLSVLSGRIIQNSHRDKPVESFQQGFQESLESVCFESGLYRKKGWESIECLGVAYIALRINSYGLLLSPDSGFVFLKNVLHGAVFFPSEAADIRIRLSPVTPQTIFFELSNRQLWEEKNFIGKTCENQEVIDSVIFFPECVYNEFVMDLFVFDQRKLRTKKGLVYQVYEESVDWCRKYVAEYSARNPDRRVGFIFGVVNPLKAISSHLHNNLQTLCDPDKMEFFFALGRDECIMHYTILKDHPSLMPRVYINCPKLTAAKLAVVLDQWSRRDDRAVAILKNRPEEGFTTWEQVLSVARLESDTSEIDESINPAIRFY